MVHVCVFKDIVPRIGTDRRTQDRLIVLFGFASQLAGNHMHAASRDDTCETCGFSDYVVVGRSLVDDDDVVELENVTPMRERVPRPGVPLWLSQ